jgi:hypothetical protein
MFEDADSNVLRESLNFFDELMQNPIFEHTPIFVCFNKRDLLEVMIRETPLSVCFPEYVGPDGDVEHAVDFVKHKFRDIMQRHQPGKAIEFCVLSARSKEDVRGAFDTVKSRLKKLVRAISIHTAVYPVRCKRNYAVANLVLFLEPDSQGRFTEGS